MVLLPADGVNVAGGKVKHKKSLHLNQAIYLLTGTMTNFLIGQKL
jgi:hypothetical protein